MSATPLSTRSKRASKVVALDDAIASIADGDAVAAVGVLGWLSPDALFAALERRFLASGGPRGLTFFLPVFSGDAMEIGGFDRVAHPGLVKRVVSGSFINPRHPRSGARPATMRMIAAGELEAYAWPIGATMHWLREVARRSPGYLTKIGLDTYADPLLEGTRVSASGPPLVERVDFKGETYLFYPSWDLDVALLRATSADDLGNLSFEREPLVSSSLEMALATKASGGRVIAQVERIVPAGRPAREVTVPGSLVDMVVVAPDPLMTTDSPFDEAYMGAGPAVLRTLPPLAAGADRVIARRAAREVQPGIVSIFGFGASANIPLALVESGTLTEATYYDYLLTTEHGVHGGIVMNGWTFSANIGPSALIGGAAQFDFIDGGNCPFAALAFAEIDAEGRANVSRFGSAHPGAGGYTDIAENARELVLTGTFNTGGLKVSDGPGLSILKEGSTPKLVERVSQVTYDLRRGVVERGQRVLIVTERAVFRVERDGLVLAEIAPGIDLEADVLAQMGFRPIRIDDPLPTMDAGLFGPLEEPA